jgi:hypothetical protein
MPFALTLTVASALLALLSTGFHVALAALPLLAFPVAAGFALTRRLSPALRQSRRHERLVLAVGLAFACTWFGLASRAEYFPGKARDLGQYSAWLEQHHASEEIYQTFVVTGFPLQRIEGHGGGGAPDHLPVGKGLGILFANFGLLLAVCSLGIACVPRRLLEGMAWMAVVAAPVSGYFGLHVLMHILD